jgi:glutamate synthase (NADPH) large chain
MTNGLVVVLGKTGRNFAAGMSGGLAYVLDETGEFSHNQCNKTSVDLEQVFDPGDQLVLKTLIYRHFDATKSPRARWVLENWTAMLPKFVKVYPHEFKRVMEKQAVQTRIPVHA